VDEPPADADPVFGPWNLANYQLAAVNDGINRLLAAYAGAPMPDPTPRPTLKTRKGAAFDPAAVAYLQAIRDRHAREAGA
jgi:Flp pilus assembly protein TadG